MKVILANGVETFPIMVTGGHKYEHGANRDTLRFVYNKTENMEDLKNLYTEANCETITIEEENGNKAIHTGYVIRTELAEKPVEIEQATATTDAVYEDRVFVSMSQRTYAETKLAEIEAQNMDTALAVAELGVLLTGGIE